MQTITRSKAILKTRLTTTALIVLGAAGIAAAIIPPMINKGQQISCGEYKQKACQPCLDGLTATDQLICSCPAGMKLSDKQCIAVAPIQQPISSPIKCSKSVAEFKKTGDVICGDIHWRLHPRHAQLLPENIFSYLMKYQVVYEEMSVFTGYKPQTIVFLEQCRKHVKGDCPNGNFQWDHGAMFGDNSARTIYIPDDFMEFAFPFLASDTLQPISSSFVHEMGHIFTAPGHASRAYIWDSALSEATADVFGPLAYSLKTQLNGLQRPFYWNAWCEKYNEGSLCNKYFHTMDDYAAMGANDIYNRYVNNKETFASVFPVPDTNADTHARGGRFVSHIIELARISITKGKGEHFYNALRKTYTYYHSGFESPIRWGDYYQEKLSKEERVNFFIFLLSVHLKEDLSGQFKDWRYPVSEKTQSFLSKYQSDGWREDKLKEYVYSFLDLKDPVPVGTGDGLKGEYFSGNNFNKTEVVRIDETVNIGRTSGQQAFPNIGFDCSARWTGYIEPLYTGAHTFALPNFAVFGGHGARLWVSDKLILDDWNGRASKYSTPIALNTGTKYDVKLEYRLSNYNCIFTEISLAWRTPYSSTKLIPKSQLYSSQSVQRSSRSTNCSVGTVRGGSPCVAQ